MTCVVAIANDTKVFVGFDSTASSNETYILSATPKAQIIGNHIVGFAGSWATGQRAIAMLSAYSMDLKRFLKDFDSDEEDWQLLIASAGEILEVTADRSVVSVMFREGVGYNAIGSGSDVALGSLHGDHRNGRRSVERALEASAAHALSVRPPFAILSL